MQVLPGLESSPWHELAKRQLTRGFGGILTFRLGNKQECFTVMDRLKLVRRATHINDNKNSDPASGFDH